ncbi:MAG TPA: VTT domain-containing protein [Propioniciclava sp.]|jgi:membrane-associated protein|uniref:DedA family protein n=1 Tax=Propioniciclava sp. TaxID=2038686 RepID=UPI002B587A78|nr:VTT domain-containing protein [Propioniciclava sp.]HRL49886.1 VTT domain-containing protein [Propioniciclava sp.]HRL79636.1 VTT domain-containing protein [Propioniciclava sp.]
MDIMGWLGNLTNASALLASFGPWVLVGMGIVVFIESGLLFPFLPGDSLLVTAAILRGSLGITGWQILLVAIAAAIAGDQAGFWLGRRFGRGLFKPNARVLRTDRLEAAEAFFDRHGPMALVLGRFVPIVRTYVPLVAGTANMRYRHFALWNILGALCWVVAMTLVGVLLGGIPGIAHNIEAIMLVIVGISVAPLVVSTVRSRWAARRAAQAEQA